MRWESAHPATQKIGIVRTLLHRAKLVCNSQEDYIFEKKHLIENFSELGYPICRIMDCIRKFETQAPPTQTMKKERNSVVLSLPYIPGLSQKITRIWKRTARQFSIGLETDVVQRPIGSLKSSLSHPYPSDPPGKGLYRVLCQECTASYIGETSLHLESRKKSHKCDKDSALYQHQHNFESLEWTFLARAHESNKRKIYEHFAIVSDKLENNLNINRNNGVFLYCF